MLLFGAEMFLSYVIAGLKIKGFFAKKLRMFLLIKLNFVSQFFVSLTFPKMKGIFLRILCFLLLVNLSDRLWADDPETFRAEVDTMAENTAKMDRLMEISRELARDYPTEAVQFANEALTVAQDLRSKTGVVEAHSNIGLVLLNQRQSTQARESFQKAIRLKKQLIASSPFYYNASISEDHRLIGISFDQQNNFSEAIGFFREGISYATKGKSSSRLAQLYNSLGETQIKAEQYQEAVGSFQQALKYVKPTSNPKFERTIDKNLKTSYALLEKYMEAQKYMMEVEAFEVETDSFVTQIETIKDSLEGVHKDRQLIIGEKKLIEIERDKEKSKSEALELEKEALELRENQYKLMGGGGALIFGIITIGLFFRARARKKHNIQLAVANQKSEELLYNILPSSIAQDLLDKKKILPQRYENATILFTDFKGFTSIAAKLKPEELVAELDTIFGRFDIIVEKYGLEKIKTIGDAFMAASGVPNPKTGADHAIDAVAAALEMQQAIEQWAEHNRKAGKPIWELRIGLNSGPIVAGVIGDRKFAFDVWGDTVNVASRMESSSEAGKVNISQSTYELVHRYCHCEYRGKISVKNKGEVEMYFAHAMLASRKTQAAPQRKKENWWRSA